VNTGIGVSGTRADPTAPRTQRY